MPKQGEIDYLHKIGPAGREHARNKPFSDPQCGLYLTDIGAIMKLLPPAPARLLDLGVGSGWTSIFFAKRGYSVVGQDIAPEMIKLAFDNKHQNQIENLDFIVADYEDLSMSEQFDCAVFYDSLHHAEDEVAALRCAFNSLRPGGVLVTAEPGAGHAESESSLKAIQEYGVTEKDMPPQRIVETGLAVGFSGYRVFNRQFRVPEITPRKRKSRFSIAAFLKAYKACIDPPSIMEQSHFVVLTK